MRSARSHWISFILALTVFPLTMFGQYYNLGQDPASLKWRQIITPHFRIIYPENFEQKAIKMISTADFAYAFGTKTLAFKPGRLPIILHNYNITANALTIWAPKRIEMYTCPPQDMYAEDWMVQLIKHEYRHVVQIDRTNQGFTKVLSWLTGQQAATGINGIFVPAWFMEGDAVCAETALGKSGRGRMPAFEMLLRAQVMQKGSFSYDKAAFGSYKTFVPGKYELGYTMVANVRRKYGYQAWVTALDEVARKPFIITPFNHGLKKATGFSKLKLFQMTMHEMDSIWKNQNSQTRKSDITPITKTDTKNYESYKFPVFLNDSLVVSEYSSLDDITRFVICGPDGYRKIVTTPGYLSSEKFSAVSIPSGNQLEIKSGVNKTKGNYLIAWTETINDIRWEQRNYSVIRIYDGNTHKIKSLTFKSRYFAPAFSPDGLSLAVVSIDPTNRNSIVLIDTKTGKETATVMVSDSDFYMTPSWSGDGTKIVFTQFDRRGKSIRIFDLKKQTLITLLPPTFIEISNPVFAKDYVLFNGSYSGIENIYAINLKSHDIFQVTSAEFGASNAALSQDGKKIVFSNYSSTGFNLAETSFTPSEWKNLSGINDFSPSLYKYLVKEEGYHTDTLMGNNTTYQSEIYKKAAHIFNFHSWAPAYINYMSGENGTGIAFMSQNELSTATTEVGYKYDMTENTGKVTADFSWMAWFPIIDLSTSYGARTAYTGNSVRYNYNETVISGGITLPLQFTGGKYNKGVNLKIHTSMIDVTNNSSPETNKLEGIIHSLDYSFSVYRFIKQSGRDLYPRWGQVFTGEFRHTPFGDYDYGSLISAGTRLYFPGLMKHQGIRLDLNWQQRIYKHNYYANQITLPRGYYISDAKTMSCFALNYKFPFAYPDLSLGPLVYLKRLKANLFYDGGTSIKNGLSQQLRSTGVEITSDLHFLRFVFPMDLGVRLGYLPIEKQYFSELLFSVNLSN